MKCIVFNDSMNRRIISILITLFFMYCGAAQGKTLKVVTTTSDLASIAGAIAGPKADIKSICTGREDPHFLQARPGYILLARDADLWIRVGMELEVGWESPVLEGSRNRNIQVGSRGHLDGSELIIPLEVPRGPVSRAMGDVHPHGNPHYWLDPLNVRILASGIRDRLVMLDPENKDQYDLNLSSFKKSLDEHMFGKALVEKIGGEKLWTIEMKGQLVEFLKNIGLEDETGGWFDLMKPLRGKEIVVYHRSWIYFCERFGLSISAELEPKPGIPPSPSHIVKVIEEVKNSGISRILLEPFYSRKAADKVALETGARVIVCPNSVNGHPDAYNYFALMGMIINRVTEKK